MSSLQAFANKLGEVLADELHCLEERILTSIEFGANTISQKERHAAATLLVEGDLQCLGDCILSGVVQASQEQDETLLCPWRIALAEGLDDSTV